MTNIKDVELFVFDLDGTVYIGVATEHSVHAERHTFGRNAAEREYVRYLAASAAISAAIKALDE